MKKGIKFCDLSVLNFIYFLRKSGPLKFLDKLEQAMYAIFANQSYFTTEDTKWSLPVKPVSNLLICQYMILYMLRYYKLILIWISYVAIKLRGFLISRFFLQLRTTRKYKGFSFIICLTIVTLILITTFRPHTAGLHQVIVLIYWVELFVPSWLLVIGVSQTSLMIGGFRSKELLALWEEVTDPSAVRCGRDRLPCCLIVGIHT